MLALFFYKKYFPAHHLTITVSVSVPFNNSKYPQALPNAHINRRICDLDPLTQS